MPRDRYMALIRNTEDPRDIRDYEIFIKEYDYFVSQGGLREPWGEKWIPILADGIEDARQVIRHIAPFVTHRGKIRIP